MITYRYRGPYGFLHLVANDAPHALREAARSTPNPDIKHLQVWDGERYAPVKT